jgi:hypothetical protein
MLADTVNVDVCLVKPARGAASNIVVLAGVGIDLEAERAEQLAAGLVRAILRACIICPVTCCCTILII